MSAGCWVLHEAAQTCLQLIDRAHDLSVSASSRATQKATSVGDVTGGGCFDQGLLLPTFCDYSDDSGNLARVHFGSPEVPETKRLTERFLRHWPRSYNHSCKKMGNVREKMGWEWLL